MPPATSDCVFCKIAAGQLAANQVWESDECLAFLDINPLAEGHLLLIPKRHYTTLHEMPGEAAAAIGRALPDLARAVCAAVGCEAYNVLQNNGRLAGQVVGHVHFHIIPRQADDQLGYRWPAGKYEEGRAQQLRNRIVQALNQAP